MSGADRDLDLATRVLEAGLIDRARYDRVVERLRTAAPGSAERILAEFGVAVDRLGHAATLAADGPDLEGVETIADAPRATVVGSPRDDQATLAIPSTLAAEAPKAARPPDAGATVDFTSTSNGAGTSSAGFVLGEEVATNRLPSESAEFDALIRLDPLGPGDETSVRERYTLTRLHAKGGIGQVWLARDAALGREVALKELRPEQFPNRSASARFLEEARITGQLEHPGIVPVYELRRDGPDSNPFYTMRFVRGGTLENAIREHHAKRKEGTATALDRAALLNAFVAVCNAIHYAHSRGVVHRDLKGQNIMLGDFGEVMVLDWGLAKLFGREDDASGAEPDSGPGVSLDPSADGHNPTLDGQIQGTPAFMAPEQAEGRVRDVDVRTDVYGLGAILYCVLTGQAPFAGGTTLELLRHVSHTPPPPPRAIDPSVPKGLEAVCLKALEKRSEDRYQTAGDLALDVKRWLADEPVSAYAEPWPVRLGRWAKRHRSAVASAAAVLVIGTIALGATSVLVARERDEARRQRRQARLAVDDMYTKVADDWLENNLDPLQTEFLDKALAYYESFAADDASDPTARLERGRAFLRKGDVLRKLGRHDGADPAHRKAVEILNEAARVDSTRREAERHLAAAETSLGLSLAERGGHAEAEPLLRMAAATLAALAPDAADPALAAERGRAERGLANLLRVTGSAGESETLYRGARERLETAVAKHPDAVAARRELALVDEGLGLVLRETNRADLAREAYGKSVDLLEKLVAQAPTLPRFRDGLARTYNSLGLLVRETGKTEESEAVLRRQIALNERLTEDFPLRPEYRRALARGLINLAILERERGDVKPAVETLRRALAINEKLSTEFPAVLDHRRDQARCLNNLGECLVSQAKFAEAEPLFSRSVGLYDALIAAAPSVPAHRYNRAAALLNQAFAQQSQGKNAPAETAYAQAAGAFLELSAEHPDNPDYVRAGVRCLGNRARLLSKLKKFGEAEEFFARATDLQRPRATAPGAPAADRLLLVETLSNRAENLRKGALPGAEARLNEAISVARALTEESPKTREYRRFLAVARLNLGEVLADARRPAEAETAFAEAVKDFEAVDAQGPANADARTELAYALSDLAKLKTSRGRPDDARAILARAVELQRSAVALNPRANATRVSLQDQLKSLAETMVALGDHSEAAKTAEEIVRIAPESNGVREQAAKLLAGFARIVGGDPKTAADRRDSIAGAYADRAIALLRDAIDRGELAADGVSRDESYRPLRSRDGFKSLAAAGAI